MSKVSQIWGLFQGGREAGKFTADSWHSMKLSVYLSGLLLLSAILMAMMPQVASSEMTVLTQKDHGKEITVPMGTVIQIELAAAGGAGYLWEFDDLDREHFELLKTETAGTDKPGITGAPNLRRWQVRTKQRGLAELQLLYFRPWEGKDKALDRFVIRIRII